MSMEKSRYLSRIQQAIEEVGKDLVLTGSFLLVEKPPAEERKTKSGIIMAAGTDKQVNGIEANLPEFVHILATGAGYYDEDTGEDKPLDSKPGDIILVGRNDIKWFSHLGFQGYEPNTIGLCQEEAIQLRFRGIEGFQRWIEALNRTA